MFMFVFQDQKDLTNVVKNTPWTIMGTGLMILSTCSSGEVTRELEFSYSPFWVQAHGLPLNYLTRRNGSNVGSILGTFIRSDWHVSCVKISDKGYLRLRVSLDVRKPILTGFWLNRPGSLTRVWVDFKYENLGLFCYQCGRMGDSFRTYLMIMLRNREIVLSRVTNLDGGEGIWTLLILMVVYLFHLYHKFSRVKRGVRFLGARNGPTPSDDDDDDDRDGNAIGEIIVSIVFLVLLYFF
ncbi:hypothetical protein MIMGU_mgv1a017699mg [Erythranthe guttata]|uniref:Zinc knuckle CX2CX4HX4C domain-containing protein n=1 Tax=Erythranthe guttata TaxID=4155 RepID=A0A022S2J6_ERYGU|nr:hypothetical protein MIMGU_mgv1a017699mg [Erythranthe guttata]